jgi:hypothetical protein
VRWRFAALARPTVDQGPELRLRDKRERQFGDDLGWTPECLLMLRSPSPIYADLEAFRGKAMPDGSISPPKEVLSAFPNPPHF